MSHGFVALPVLVPQLIHYVRHCDQWGGSRAPPPTVKDAAHP
jgi:hypothetical protein